MAQRISDLLADVGGFSAPDKMPCYSWSIPATTCPLGTLLAKREGSTCSDCYALKGRYEMPNVVAAMQRRYAVLTRALENPVAGDAFVASFSALLNTRREATLKREARGLTVRRDGTHFRWHDSGDLQSVGHLDLLVRIAEACPLVRFWLPTREAGTVRRWLERNGPLPTNLVVRLSVPMRNEGASGLLLTLAAESNVTLSGVHDDAPAAGFDCCSAYTRGGHCGDCRDCWDPRVAGESYPRH
jgi:hypothetical protein